VVLTYISQTGTLDNVHWAVILGVAGLFTFFAGGMFLNTSWNTVNNLTTIDMLNKHTVHFIAIRSQNGVPGEYDGPVSPAGHVVLATQPGENPWDLGYWRNWCSVMGNKPWEWLLPTMSPIAKHDHMDGEYEWGPLIERMKKNAGLLAPSRRSRSSKRSSYESRSQHRKKRRRTSAATASAHFEQQE
jgi:palmitoyltransferase